MSASDTQLDWSALASKLQREKKADLIHLIQELTAISPEAQRFLQARYLKKKRTADQIAAYRKVIQEQFAFSEWDNTVSWNFVGVQKAMDDYTKSSQGDEIGLCALFMAALEMAMSFADRINLQDDDFDYAVTALAERYVELFTNHPQMYAPYARRLRNVQKIGSELGYYTLVEILDEVTNPR